MASWELRGPYLEREALRSVLASLSPASTPPVLHGGLGIIISMLTLRPWA